MADPPAARTSILLTAWLLILLALSGRAIYIFMPVGSDTAMFVYAGKLVAGGGLPGIDLLDNKLPSVGLLMSVPERLVGAFWPAYGVIGLTLSIGASLMLWRLARRHLGASAAVLVGVASVVWLNFTPGVYGQLQLETIEIFFTTCAAAAAVEWIMKQDWRDAAAAGLCGGMAMWAKPTAAAVLAAAGLAMLASRVRWSTRAAGAVALCCGAFGPIVVCMWLIVITGMADGLGGTLKQLHDYAAGSNLDWSDYAKPACVVAALLFPLLILGVILRRDRDDSPRPSATGKIAFFAVAWFTFELAAVISQRRMYAYHFLVLGPPASLLCGIPLRSVRPRTLLMAFGPAAAVAFAWAITMVPAIGRPNRDTKMIAYVRSHVMPNQAVWVDDYARLLMETDLAPGSAVPLIFLFANSDEAPDFFTNRMLADFADRKPTMVILPSNVDRLAELYRHHMADVAGSPRRAEAMARGVRQIDAYVREHYFAVARIDGLTVYRANAQSLEPISASVSPPDNAVKR